VTASHPSGDIEIYQQGDFPMDPAVLRRALPDNARLVIGELKETVPAFLQTVPDAAPIGFVSWTSITTRRRATPSRCSTGVPPVPAAHAGLSRRPRASFHNSWCGERRACSSSTRPASCARSSSMPFCGATGFSATRWIDHMFTLHVLDHPTRTTLVQERQATILTNPYLE